jgi:hypothetical protein
MKPQIIGLYSPAPGSGKSTIAELLSAEDYEIISFASALKKMAVALLESCGYTNREARKIVNEKDMVIPGLNTRCRTILQTLGTDWGRNIIGENIWVNVWKMKANHCKYVVADDVRFHNEAEAIKELGGQVWKVVRPSVTNKETHASEGRLNDWDGFDRIIINDGTIKDLADNVMRAMNYDIQG